MLTPEMHDALHDLSLSFDLDPRAVCRRVVQTLSRMYGGTMAMVNLTQEGEQVAIEVANPSRWYRRYKSLPVTSTYCQYAMSAGKPILIQNAAEEERYAAHPGVRAGVRRYLGVPIFDPRGAPIGTLCIADDQVEQKLGEADLQFISLLGMRVSAEVERERLVQARVDEHRRTAEQLAQLNAQLEATSEEKRQFVSMVIHDLRHPLTAMVTLLYLARSEADPCDRAKALAAIENRIGALAALLDQLTEYSAIEAGKPRLKLAAVDVADLVRQCVEGFQPLHAEGLPCIECEVDDALGDVRSDANMLTHILANLISNAVKYSAGDSVKVRAARASGGRWALEVEDRGRGIADADQARIFDEFFRSSEDAAGAPPGAGLGLAIVKRLCGALGAEMTMASKPGHGTRICVTLPAYAGDPSECCSGSTPL